MNYQKALAFAVDMATAIVATPRDRIPFVLCDLRAKGLTNEMVRALKPLWLKDNMPLLRIPKRRLDEELLNSLLNSKPNVLRGVNSYSGECEKDRMKNMLGQLLEKPETYFYATLQPDQKYFHRAAYALGMVIGTKLCRDHQARLVWRIS